MSDDFSAPIREPAVRAVEAVDGATVLRLWGELDLYNAEELRSALASALAGNPAKIVVDMTDVTFVDSTTLGVLVEARSKLGPAVLLLAAPQVETARALQVSGLDRHLPVHGSVDDALQAR